jgi:hypothetical protein
MLREARTEEVLPGGGAGLSSGGNSAGISAESSVGGGCSAGVKTSFSGRKVGFSSP